MKLAVRARQAELQAPRALKALPVRLRAKRARQAPVVPLTVIRGRQALRARLERALRAPQAQVRPEQQVSQVAPVNPALPQALRV